LRSFFDQGDDGLCSAETPLAAKGIFFLDSAMRANILGIAIGRIPAGEHLLHGFYNEFPMRRFVSPG
jgi:hypothetical protein